MDLLCFGFHFLSKYFFVSGLFFFKKLVLFKMKELWVSLLLFKIMNLDLIVVSLFLVVLLDMYISLLGLEHLQMLFPKNNLISTQAKSHYKIKNAFILSWGRFFCFLCNNKISQFFTVFSWQIYLSCFLFCIIFALCILSKMCRTSSY